MGENTTKNAADPITSTKRLVTFPQPSRGEGLTERTGMPSKISNDISAKIDPNVSGI